MRREGRQEADETHLEEQRSVRSSRSFDLANQLETASSSSAAGRRQTAELRSTTETDDGAEPEGSTEINGDGSPPRRGNGHYSGVRRPGARQVQEISRALSLTEAAEDSSNDHAFSSSGQCRAAAAEPSESSLHLHRLLRTRDQGSFGSPPPPRAFDMGNMNEVSDLMDSASHMQVSLMEELLEEEGRRMVGLDSEEFGISRRVVVTADGRAAPPLFLRPPRGYSNSTNVVGGIYGPTATTGSRPGREAPTTLLHHLIRAHEWDQALARLRDYPGDARDRDYRGNTVLHEAMERNAPLRFIKALVDANHALCRVRRLEDGWTPIHCAVSVLKRRESQKVVPLDQRLNSTTFPPPQTVRVHAVASTVDSSQARAKDGDDETSNRGTATDIPPTLDHGDGISSIARSTGAAEDSEEEDEEDDSDDDEFQDKFCGQALFGTKTTGLSTDEGDHKGSDKEAATFKGGELDYPLAEAVRYMLSKCPLPAVMKDKGLQTPLEHWAGVFPSMDGKKRPREEYNEHVAMLKALLSPVPLVRQKMEEQGWEEVPNIPELGGESDPLGPIPSLSGLSIGRQTASAIFSAIRVYPADGTTLHNLFNAASCPRSSQSSARAGGASTAPSISHVNFNASFRISPLLTEEVLRLLIEANPAVVTALDSQEDTPLHSLMMNVHQASLEFPVESELVHHGDESDVGRNDALVPVIHSRKQTLGIVGRAAEILIETKPEILTMKNRTLKTPLHIACESDASPSLVKLLLESSVRTSGPTRELRAEAMKDSADMLPLHLACKHRAHAKTIEMVLSANQVLASQKDANNETPFSYLTNSFTEELTANIDVIKLIAGSTAKALFQEPCGDDDGTFLHRAVLLGAPGKVIQVIHEASPEAAETTDGKGNTPLHIACREKKASMEVARYLLKSVPACAGIQNAQGDTPLHLACKRGLPMSIAKSLMKAAPESVLMKNEKGNTALHLVCANGASMISAVRMMLTVVPHAALIGNSAGKTPLFLASASAGAAPKLICALLEASPESASLPRNNGTTPLLAAIESGASLSAVSMLFEQYPQAVMKRNNLGAAPVGAMVRRARRRNGNAQVTESNFPGTLGLLEAMLERYPAASTILDRDGRSPLYYAFMQYQKRVLSKYFPIHAIDKVGSEFLLSLCKGDSWTQLYLLLKASLLYHVGESDFLLLHSLCNSDCPHSAIKFGLAARPEDVRLRSKPRGWLPLHLIANKQVRWRVEAVDCPNEDESVEGDNTSNASASTLANSDTENEVDGVQNHTRIDSAVDCDDIHLSVESILAAYPAGAAVLDNEGRLPLNLCIESGKGWESGLRKIMEAATLALQTRDVKTHMFPAMLAAASPLSTINDVYELLIANPSVVSTDRERKVTAGCTVD